MTWLQPLAVMAIVLVGRALAGAEAPSSTGERWVIAAVAAVTLQVARRAAPARYVGAWPGTCTTTVCMTMSAKVRRRASHRGQR